MMQDRIGLNCALSTPFRADQSVDPRRLVAHAGWVMANGCDGVTVFGTTGEGASLGLPPRHQILAALDTAGIDLNAKVFAGVSAAAIEDVIAQSRLALEAGCRGLLLAPPFYFRGVSDEALFAFFAHVIEALGTQARGILLYHIPGMTGVHLSIALTQRLSEAFPGVIIGLKDSHGDWAATERRLTELPGLQILVGDERQLSRAVRKGGAGSICGLANVTPDLLRPLAWNGVEDDRVNQMVTAILGHSFMPAIKALIAARLDDPAWRMMRAPLDPINAEDAAALHDAIQGIRAAPGPSSGNLQ